MTTAVRVRNLWEEFRIVQDRAASFKEVITRFRLSKGKRSVWALKDVSLEIEHGRTVGLIGENGSGKSTLLRCLAGILVPTKGEVLVSGPVSSLIELGAGFHPELTGRENVRLTGALYGFRRKDLERRLREIIDFAELSEVIDQPVRSYSSGMYVRLAFSIAVHVEPEIFLIDEVLAVGDERFQRKCVERIGKLGSEGVTIIFVSHDLTLVERVCSRSLLLHQGELVAEGSTAEVAQRYLQIEGLDSETWP